MSSFHSVSRASAYRCGGTQRLAAGSSHIHRTQTPACPSPCIYFPTHPFSAFPQVMVSVTACRSFCVYLCCLPSTQSRGGGGSEGTDAFPEAEGAEPSWTVGIRRPEEPESAAAWGVRGVGRGSRSWGHMLGVHSPQRVGPWQKGSLVPLPCGEPAEAMWGGMRSTGLAGEKPSCLPPGMVMAVFLVESKIGAAGRLSR